MLISCVIGEECVGSTIYRTNLAVSSNKSVYTVNGFGSSFPVDESSPPFDLIFHLCCMLKLFEEVLVAAEAVAVA